MSKEQAFITSAKEYQQMVGAIIETLPGTDPGSVYLVLAKSPDGESKYAVRVGLGRLKGPNSDLAIVCRVRMQGTNQTSIYNLTQTHLKEYGFVCKGKHASTVLSMATPAKTPQELTALVDFEDSGLAKSIYDTLMAPVPPEYVHADPAMLVQAIKEILLWMLPELPATPAGLTPKS